MGMYPSLVFFVNDGNFFPTSEQLTQAVKILGKHGLVDAKTIPVLLDKVLPDLAKGIPNDGYVGDGKGALISMETGTKYWSKQFRGFKDLHKCFEDCHTGCHMEFFGYTVDTADLGADFDDDEDEEDGGEGDKDGDLQDSPRTRFIVLHQEVGWDDVDYDLRRYYKKYRDKNKEFLDEIEAFLGKKVDAAIVYD